LEQEVNPFANIGKGGRAAARITAAALAICLATVAVAYADWSDFRGAENGLTHVKTPRAASEAVVNWARGFPRTDAWYSVGTPVIAGGSIYIAVSKNLYRLDHSGNVTGTAALKSIDSTVSPAAVTDGEIGYASFLSYGDGKVFVPLKGGDIQAFDATTMKSLWISDYDSATAYKKKLVKYKVTDAALAPADAKPPVFKSECQTLYRTGWLYTGVYYYQNSKETFGTFFAIDATDDDPSDEYESKPFSWEYEEPSGSLQGYYWAGVCAAGGYIIFGGDAGVLHAVAEKPSAGAAVAASAGLESAVGTNSGAMLRAGMLFQNGALYFATKSVDLNSGRVWRVPFDSSPAAFGAPKAAALSGGPGASIPVVYGSKLYALSGFINSGGRLDVFDAGSLARKATLDFGGYSQSSPLVSDAYATAKGKIYLYACLNEQGGDQVVVIEDGTGSAARPKASVLYSPGGNQSLNSVVADDTGSMYFADGKGRLVSLGSRRFGFDPVRKVALNARGGKVTGGPLTAIYGGKYPAAPKPVRKGYTFKGWYLDKAYKKAYKAGQTVSLKKDITIYAKWAAKKFKVKFNVNKGKALKKSLRTKTVTYAAKYGKLPAPKRGGYRFKGWYTKKSGGKKVTAKSKVAILKTQTLYARWKKV
jgi:uncharacterized repeat protein (TIGR02543 family)